MVASRIAACISPRIADGRVLVDHQFHNPLDLLGELDRFDAVIATRMHMAILALAAGVPVLPIAYEFKTVELFARLGMADWVTAIEDVNPENFPATVQGFIDALPGSRKQLFVAVGKERQLALSAGPLLRSAASQARTAA
ncbi:MAG: polysaccharide pyruvyl transferase family protein [Rhodospirillaceae bacterium]|nr:polysaccharide pyruvyl transferase family protein [Rhodospirillaceae bacterium]